jgi:diguanylate cyclase (GGDEF)-like protein
MVASIQSIEKTALSLKPQATNGSQLIGNVTEVEKLQFITALQSTLDLEQLLQTFLTNLNAVVRTDGIHYQEETRDIKLKLGKQSAHSCGYNLLSGERNYGELVFKRSKRFTEAELQQIEDLLVLLLVPISNSLQYADAVHEAIQDPITNVGNRIAMEKSLNHEIELAKRHNHSLSLLTICFDSSTHKNSGKARASVVSTLSDVIQNVSRCTDMLFRTGEREFCLIMHNGTDATQPVARRIEKAIKRAFNHGDSYGIRVKSGYSTLTGTDSMKSLIDRAKQKIQKITH